ncbi:hypothetical protein CEP54_005577 [Fusarium duplospermum]|uniref:NACHT domain-containing protein n=1 Tax=Fusarium duplospermum TaxID=1325734 RepID=A0A428QBG5_9HYPO|nr:hypothetical protein CEP54_005577 [Fusarium duplospermum]
MSATHMGRGDMFHNAGTQNICMGNGTQIIRNGESPQDRISRQRLKNWADSDKEAEQERQDRQCRNYLDQNGYDPADQKANAERQGGQLFEPACHWIYDNAEFQQWRHGIDPSSLWLHGGPGKGKSMLLCSVINRLLDSTKGASVASNPSLLVTYSFFSNTDGVCEASFVLASLIYGLVKQQPSYLRRVSKFYDHENKYPFKGKRSFTALEGILEDMLHNTTGARVILVVDALDECTADLRRLLHFILSTSSLQKIRWLVSSRGLRIIHQEFEAAGSQMQKLSLDQTGKAIHQAVQAYTHHRMSRLHIPSLSEEERKELQNRLLSKAGGTFLWLSLVMTELENVDSWDIDDVVQGLPDDLESLYQTLLQNLQEDLGRGKNKNLAKDVLQKTLATATAALRPLYIEELKELAGFPAQIRDTSQVEEVVDKCGAFLIRQNNQVFLIHLSAKEFLTHDKLQSAFQSSPLDIHSHLFFRSIFVMKANLKRDIYNLKEPGVDIDEIDTTPFPDPLSRLKYSCVHWVDHLEQVQEKDPSHYQAVRCFIEKWFLYWLEAMSLQRKIGGADKAARKLHSLMQNTKDYELDSLTEDVLRFVTFQRQTIEEYPLQTYVSALLFSPAGSWIRRLYGGEEPTWISLKPRMETAWSTPIETLSTSCVPENVALAIDGKLLAATFMSASTSVDIWELDSYEWIRELILDFEVHALGFLSTGKRLALAGSQNRFEIWDAETGSLLQMLQSPDGPSVWFTSLAVSTQKNRGVRKGIHDPTMNGDLIALGSEDGTVRFWNPATGNCSRMIHTSGQEGNPMEFSPDFQKFAVGLKNGSVEVWDSRSGSLIWVFEGHDKSILSMAFFGYDQLASASHETISIWDLKTGDCVKILDMGNHTKLASLGGSEGFASRGYCQSTIKIWNSKGDCVQVLEGHEGGTGPLTFCAGQQLLASSTAVGISIWDLKLCLSSEPVPVHNQPVCSITLSPDGLLLASGSDDSIKIWETTNCTCIRSINCNKTEGTGFAFSPDNRYLVSRAKDQWGDTVLAVWNLEIGKLVKKFPSVSELEEAFSPDSRLLALVMDTSTVMIWDMVASQQHCQIQSSVTSLLFTADGHRFVLASDTHLEIWDMCNGECIWTVDHQQTKITSIALSQDMQLLAAATDRGSVDVWDIGAKALHVTVSAGHSWVDAVAFSPNQQLLALADNYEIRLRNLMDGREARFWRFWGLKARVDGRTTIQFHHYDSSRLCTPIGDVDIRDGYSAAS